MPCPTAKITPQHPIGSGFGAETTAAEVIRGIEWSLSERLIGAFETQTTSIASVA